MYFRTSVPPYGRTAVHKILSYIMPKKAGKSKRRYRRRRYKKKSYSNQTKGFSKKGYTPIIQRSYLTSSNVMMLEATNDSTDFYYRGTSCIFKINASPEATTFLKYYRFYRIVGIKLKIINDSPVITSATNDASDYRNQYSQFSICVIPDHEGSTEAMTSESEWTYMLNNRTKKVRDLNPGQTMSVALRPNILTVLYESLTNSGYRPSYNAWIRNDDTSVPFYGFRIGVKYKSRRTLNLRLRASMIIQYKEPCIDSKFSLSTEVDAVPFLVDHSGEDCASHEAHSSEGAVLITDDDETIETDQHVGNAPATETE